MTERDNDIDIQAENPDNTGDQLSDQNGLASEEQLEDASADVTSEDITDTEFGEDPDIEVPTGE